MLKNKLFAATTVILLTSAFGSAFAQPAGITIDEATSHRSELLRAKWKTELSELQGKSGGNTLASVGKTCDEELSMYSVYGVDNKLRADFGYQGTTVTLAPGDKREVGGWYVDELNTTRAITVRKAKGKIVARCPVYLTTITKQPMMIGGAGGSVGSTNVTVPPIIPAAPSEDAPGSNQVVKK